MIQINDLIKEAMHNKDMRLLGVLKLIKSEFVKKQTEAGRSLGLSRHQTLFKIILPQAVKAVLPTYASEFIVLIKETSVASFIAVMDMTKAGDMIRSATYNAWIPLLSCAVIYLIFGG